MTKKLSDHAAAAKIIRAELKRHGIKAQVRARSYAGGSSVDVNLLEDVLPATLREIKAFVSRFQYGHFDGMTDSYEYSNRSEDLPQVRFAFVNPHYSDELRADAEAYVREIQGIAEYEVGRYVSLVLAGTWGDFWTSRKPRARAS